MISSFVSLNGAIPVRPVHSFLVVALNERLALIDYQKFSGISQSTMSRHLLDLGRAICFRQPV